MSTNFKYLILNLYILAGEEAVVFSLLYAGKEEAERTSLVNETGIFVSPAGVTKEGFVDHLMNYFQFVRRWEKEGDEEG